MTKATLFQIAEIEFNTQTPETKFLENKKLNKRLSHKWTGSKFDLGLEEEYDEESIANLLSIYIEQKSGYLVKKASMVCSALSESRRRLEFDFSLPSYSGKYPTNWMWETRITLDYKPLKPRGYLNGKIYFLKIRS